MSKDPRFSVSEAKTVIDRIPALKGLLRVSSDDEEAAPSRGGEMSAYGFAYMSRFNKDIKLKVPKALKVAEEEFEESSTARVETKSVDLHHKHSTEKHLGTNRRYAMSLASLSSKPEKRLQIVKEGAISALLELASINDSFIQRSCAAALSQLASSEEEGIKSRMIEEGALASVISLSGSSNYDIKVDCCHAMVNLTAEPGSEPRAAKDGTSFAVMHIASMFPEFVDLCLKVLVNMSCVSDKYARIEDVSEVLNHFQHFSSSDAHEALILSALCNLSALRNNQLRLVEDGACLKMIERAWRSADPVVRKLASDNVRNLTTDAKTRSKLLEQDILSLLLSMARDPYEEIKISAIRALFNLSKDPLCRFKLATSEVAIAAILKLSTEKFQNIDATRTSGKIIKILCGDPMTSVKLVRHNIVEALLSLLSSGDAITQQYCVECICVAICIKEVQEDVIAQGAVKVIISLVHANIDQVTTEWCAYALYHVSTNQLCAEDEIEESILPCLIKLCGESTSVKTKTICSSALDFVTKFRNIDASVAIGVLVRMLTDEDEQVTKTNCASALYNLAGNNENCRLMLEAGALMPVVILTRSDHLHTKVKCAAILSRLALHKEYNHLFEGNDVLEVLLALSSVDHIITQRRIVIALSNLSQNEKLRKQLMDLNPIPYIISLASKRDEQLWQGIVSIICNLSYESGSEVAMVKGGIIKTLLITALVNADHIESKITSVKAITNLLADRTLHAQMVHEGLIWGLSSLALIDNIELINLCAGDLCLLSGNYGSEMITSGASIKALFKLINHEDLNLQRQGARMLLNILLKTKGTDEKFRNLVVANMKCLARSKDEELMEICILSLCLVSQSESCRPAIVDSNMLKMIDASAIFTLPIVSYAYLTMFGNIANNPSMRAKLLDDQSIPRFRQICLSRDPNLDMATIKAIYNITCAPENISTLAEQNILSIVGFVLQATYVKSPDLIHHLAAILFNMSVDPPNQAKSVSQNAVALYMSIWRMKLDISIEVKVKKLIVSGICHLACGNVNSARMVEEGCTEVLLFVPKNQYHRQKKGQAPIQGGTFVATGAMCNRCAAGIRNLLCTSSNQGVMLNAGVLQALISLFKGAEAFEFRDDIQINCAAALRCLTFNKDARAAILESGAIDVILADPNNDEELGDSNSPSSVHNKSIAKGLLIQLEEESWQNGVRGLKREGRAAVITPAGLHGDLICAIAHVELDVEIRRAEITKHYVQCSFEAETEESTVEVAVPGSSVFSVSINELATKKADGSDDAVSTVIKQCPKFKCDVEYNLILNARSTKGLEFVTVNHIAEEYQDFPFPPQTIDTNPRRSPTSILPELKADDPLNVVNHCPPQHPEKAKRVSISTAEEGHNSHQLPKLISNSHRDSSSQNNNNNNNSHSSSNINYNNNSSSNTLGQSLPAPMLGGFLLDDANNNTLPKGSSHQQSKSKLTKTKKSNPDAKFNQILSLIKHSKSSEGALIGEVLKEWNSLSKF